MNPPWWRVTPLSELSADQWERLCDGCGICCLHKLEDEEDGTIYTTDLACELLDCATARCSDYDHRTQRVPECIVLRAEDVERFRWLPPSCAYRLVAEGRDLPEWHPLRSGDPDSALRSGHTVAGRCTPAREVPPEEIENHLMLWTPPIKA
ncbi:MAG: YcgN family cysteine cluster protein [Pseudomonadota bacterium]